MNGKSLKVIRQVQIAFTYFSNLNDLQLKKFYNLSNKLGMDVICEVHNEEELLRAIKLKVNCELITET